MHFVFPLRWCTALVQCPVTVRCKCVKKMHRMRRTFFLTSTNDERGLCASAPGLQRKELTGQKRILLREGRSACASKCVGLFVGVLLSPSRTFGWPSSSGTALHTTKKNEWRRFTRSYSPFFRLQRRYFRENDLVSAEEMHSFGF